VLQGTVEIFSPDATVVPGQALHLVMVVTNTGNDSFYLPTSAPFFGFNYTGITVPALPWSCPSGTCPLLGSSQSMRIPFTATVGAIDLNLGPNPTPLSVEVSFQVGRAPAGTDAILSSNTTLRTRVRSAPVVNNAMVTMPADFARSKNCPQLCFRLRQDQDEPMGLVLRYAGPQGLLGRATLANGSLSPAGGGPHQVRPDNNNLRCLSWNMPLDVGRPAPAGNYSLAVETWIHGVKTGEGASASFMLTTPMAQCGSDFAGILLTEAGPPVDAAALADLDGDGNDELVSTARDPGTNAVHVQFSRGVGAGAFQGRREIQGSTEPFPVGASALVVADLNGDGNKDIAVLTADKLFVYSQTGINAGGGPMFGMPDTRDVGFTGAPTKLLAVDLTADGRPELVGFSELTGQMILANNIASVGLSLLSLSNDISTNIRDVTVADFNLDGLEDVLFIRDSGPAPGELRVLWGGPALSFPSTLLTLPPAALPAEDQLRYLAVGRFAANNPWPQLGVVSTSNALDAHLTTFAQSELLMQGDRNQPELTVSSTATLVASRPDGVFVVNINGTDEMVTHVAPQDTAGRPPFELRRGPGQNGSPVAGGNIPEKIFVMADLDKGNNGEPDIIGRFAGQQLGMLRLRSNGGLHTESDATLVPPQTSPLPTKVLSGKFTQPGQDEVVTFRRGIAAASPGSASLWHSPPPTPGAEETILTLDTSVATDGGPRVTEPAVDAVAARVVENPSSGPEQLVVASGTHVFTLAVNNAGMATQLKDTGGVGNFDTGMTNIKRVHRGRFPTLANGLDHLVVVGAESSMDAIKTVRARPGAGNWVYEALNSTRVPYGACSAVGYLGIIPSAFAQVPTVAGTASADIVRIFDLSQGNATPPLPALTKVDITSTMTVRGVSQIVPVNTEVVFFDAQSKQVRFVGDLGTAETTVLGAQGGNAVLLQAEDLNSDDGVELLLQPDGRLELRSRSVGTAVSYPTAMTLPVPGAAPTNFGLAPAVGDFNGDGALDVAVVFMDPGTQKWSVNVTYGR
jgi:hypothetical protein